MNEPIAVGAAAIVAALAVGSLGSRWYVRPLGVHRKPRVRKVLDETSLNELLGPWPDAPRCAVATQQWLDCPECGTAEPGVRIKNGWWCGHCFHAVTTDVGDFL